MGSNSACHSFIPLLSAYIDTELSPADRVLVERHLGACKACTMRAADLRAESGLLRVGMEMLADEVDFKDFSQKVLARVTPEKPPLFERLRLFLSETFTYQRGTMLTALGTAAVVLLVAVPLILRNQAPVGYGSARLEVQTVSVDESAQLEVAPVVMETDTGDAIIFLVEQKPEPKPAVRDDESRSEELEMELPSAPQPKKSSGGEL